MTLNEYIEELVRLRDEQPAGDCEVIQESQCDCGTEASSPEAPHVGPTGGGKWVVTV